MFYEKKAASFAVSEGTVPLQFPLHVHPHLEIAHIVKGEIAMQIGTGKYLLTDGDLAVVFPNVPHHYQTLSSEENTRYRIINCYPDLLPMHKKQLLEKYPVTPVLHDSQIHENVWYAERNLLEMEDLKMEDSERRDDNLASSLISLMLCRLLPRMQLADYEDAVPDLTSHILAYIDNHFFEEISLSTVADQFGIGRFTLSRIFSNVLGIGFTAYVNSLRINYSKYLLANTDMNMIQVAVEAGYNNQQTFNRVFKKNMGCTPREYRRYCSKEKGESGCAFW